MTKTCATCGHEHECSAGDEKDSKPGKQNLTGNFPDGANSGGSGKKMLMAKAAGILQHAKSGKMKK